MSENATVTTQDPATTPDKPEEKKFTQEEVNSFFNKRYGELMAKVNEYEEARDKKAEAMLLEKAEKLETELSGLKKAESIREIREEVAKETGIPAHLLTGATEEECKAQAAAIADYAKPSPYPAIKDAGEVNNVGKATTRQQFADWASKMI